MGEGAVAAGPPVAEVEREGAAGEPRCGDRDHRQETAVASQGEALAVEEDKARAIRAAGAQAMSTPTVRATAV